MSTLSTEDVQVLPLHAALEVTRAPAATPDRLLPPLRLVRAPQSEPPYDDELLDPPGVRLTPDLDQPFLPLVLHRSLPVLRHHPPVRVVPTPGDDPDAVEEAQDVAARRTALDGLPSPRRFAHALVQQLLEVRAGARALPQLQRQVTMDLYDVLSAQHRAVAPARTRPSLTSVRSLHVQSRPEGVAEVCASVERDGRRVALALRLEGKDGAWRCTHLEGW